MRTGTAAIVAALLLVPALLAASGAAEAGTQRALTITTGSAKPTVAFKAFDAGTPKLYDFNKDGRKEIVAQNDNRYVYVFDSKSGKLLAELKPRYPSSTWGARPLNPPEAAVLEPGGKPHIVAANSAAIITAWRFDGVGSDGKFRFAKAWEKRLTSCHSNPGMDSKVVLADLNGDRRLEVLAQTEEVGVYALRANGAILWKKCIGGGNGEPGVGDLNRDGRKEVVFASDGGKVTAVDGRTGATRWTAYVGGSRYGLGSGAMPVGPAVAQLDGSGGDEVVVGVRDNSDCTNYKNNHAALFAFSGTGKLRWWKQDPKGNPLTYTHPVVVDADRDGRREVYWADWNTQGHKCGKWERMGPANFYRYEADGRLRWKTSLNTFWNNKDLAIADVDGDGTQEVLANGPTSGGDAIWYLNSKTGAKETAVKTSPWKVTRGPAVANLWGHGTMQWVVPVDAYQSGSKGGAIQVYDTGVRYNAVWPHLPGPP